MKLQMKIVTKESCGINKKIATPKHYEIFKRLRLKKVSKDLQKEKVRSVGKVRITQCSMRKDSFQQMVIEHFNIHMQK